MMERSENKPSSWSLPPNYVTLDMLRERYLKAQEQKRIEMEKEERERGGGDPEKEAAGEVNNAVNTNHGSQKEMEEREYEAEEVVPKMRSKISSAAASSPPQVRTKSWNQLNSRKERGNQKWREKEEMPSKIAIAESSHCVETSSRRGLEMEEGRNGNTREKESLPPNYVTLDMLRERYLKAQEQKQIDSEREERDRTRGNPEKKVVEEVNNSVETKGWSQKEIEEREKEVPQTLIENSSAVGPSHRLVKTNRWNRRKRRRERENQKRKEKEAREITEMPSKITVEVETEDRENGKKRENEGNGEYGGKIKGKKKYRKKKKKAKADETLGRSAEKGQVDTVVVNGMVWVKKKVPVVVNPMAEIEDKFGDLLVRYGKGGDHMVETGPKIGDVLMIVGKKAKSDGTVEIGRGMSDEKGDEGQDVKKNVKGDPTAENGLKIGNLSRSNRKGGRARHVYKNKVADQVDIKKNVEDDPLSESSERRRNGRRNARGGTVKCYGNMGRVNHGTMQMDSSLVWVRKEDK